MCGTTKNGFPHTKEGNCTLKPHTKIVERSKCNTWDIKLVEENGKSSTVLAFVTTFKYYTKAQDSGAKQIVLHQIKKIIHSKGNKQKQKGNLPTREKY